MQARVIVHTCVRDRKKGELLRILLSQDQKEKLHSEHQCLQGPGLPHQVGVWKKCFWSVFLEGVYWFCYCDGVLFCFVLFHLVLLFWFACWENFYSGTFLTLWAARRAYLSSQGFLSSRG